MSKHDAYLICNDHISEVKDFLSGFFKEKKDEDSHDNSVTFVAPESNFEINLMEGHNQPLTQNVTFEMGSESRGVLEEFAKKNNTEIKTFMTKEDGQSYMYNYVEVPGPYGICKIKIFYHGDRLVS